MAMSYIDYDNHIDQSSSFQPMMERENFLEMDHFILIFELDLRVIL
jgi:hypothetical protein